MRKVFILANDESTIYNFRRELIYALVEHGYDVTAAFPRGGKRTDEIINIGCRFVDLKMDRKGTNPLADVKLIGRIQAILKQHSPDVLLTFTIKPNLYGSFVANKLGIPHIGNVTGLGTVGKEGVVQKLTLWMYRMFMKDNTHLFFQNEGDMAFLQTRGIARENARLLPGSGVNLERFQPLPYPNNNTIRFSYIGRVMKDKGIEQFLAAAKAIKAIYYDVEFHIVGPCEEAYEEILDKYEKDNVIVYHGPQNDVREFHRNSHCTVHPSYYPEGMSNVLLESAASARPVITTERNGCKEIVDNGRTGYIIPEKDSTALIDAIDRFIMLNLQLKIEMGLAGRVKVEKEFDRNIVVNMYLHEIESMAYRDTEKIS